jgi:myxalamid-type polyketide synthase MxaB
LVPSNYQEDADARGIAVIGMSGRFPLARNVDEFWRNLADGLDCIRPFEPELREKVRLGPEILRHPDYVDKAYYIDDVKLFDAEFFGFTAAEARITDPQHRIFLECVWEALESAGYISKTSRFRIGVYAGASLSYYLEQNLHASMEPTRRPTQYLQRLIGNDKDYLSTHVSYKLNLRGPSIGVQTACSTSLVALSLACQGLFDHQCDLALAGGVTVRLPGNKCLGYIYEQGNILSRDGHCRPFDASAGGTTFGSGAGVVLLKRLEEAIEDRDCILAVVKETAVNNDGAVKIGFTAPGLEGQAEVVGLAQATAGIHPETIGYIEAHGTGTPLGDPVEIAALTEVFRSKTGKQGFCAIGSVKSNVGHLESAAGMAGLIKTVLALQHRQIPPSLHFQSPNPQIDFASSPFYVNTTLREWPANGVPRRAGVSSFGIGGTNAHTILEEAPAAASPATARPDHLLVLSARDDKALTELAAKYVDFLASGPDPHAACFTANTGRRQFARRLAIVGATAEELRNSTASFVEQRNKPGVFTGHARPDDPLRVAFLFTGQGAQYAGMAKELYRTQPVFREALDRCAAVVRPLLERPLLDVLYGANQDHGLLDQTAYTQPALFSIEWALAQLWESWGVRPSVVLGHSIGELAAACVAGVFSLEDGLQLAATRGRLMQALPAGGGMRAVMAEPDRVRGVLAPFAGQVVVAAENGPRHTVISGPNHILDEALSPLASEGVAIEKLRVSHAFHSPLMEPMLAEFRRVAARVAFRPAKIPVISNLTGALAGAEIGTAQYWAEHILRPVRFAAGIQTLLARQCGALLEVGPHPVLLTMGRQCGVAAGDLPLASLRRGQSEWRQMLMSLGALYAAGADVDWDGFDAPYRPRRITQPTYPFQRSEHWFDEPDTVEAEEASGSGTMHPLLGRQMSLAGSSELRFEARISQTQPAFLHHHRVFGRTVAPMTAYLETALAAGAAALGTRRLALADVVIHQPLTLPKDASVALQTVLSPDESSAYRFEIYSRVATDPWIRHATGRVLAAAEAPGRAEAPSAADEVNVAEYYREFARRGLEYGEQFQSIRKLLRGSGESIAEVAIQDAEGFLLHPALLDGCVQATAAAAAVTETGDSATYVPAGLARLDLFAEAGARVSARTRTSPSISLELFHDPEHVVCRIEGLALRRITEAALGKETSADWVYRVAWKTQPRSATAPAGSGTWLIAGDRTDTARQLADELSRRGHRCIEAGANGEMLDRTPISGVIHCGGLRGALSAAQKAAGPLYLVTRGAQPVGDRSDPLNLEEAQVWGLAKTISLERPELNCRCFDLDSAAPDGETGELAEEILAAGDEDQVAWRGGARFVARLERWVEGPHLDVPRADDFALALPRSGVLTEMHLQPSVAQRPRAGEVRIRVVAAGINFRDVLRALGMLPDLGDAPPGSECAGIVLEAGEGVTGFQPGDEVLALAEGAMQTSMTIRQELLFPKPANLDFAHAAAMPIAYLTAYYGLHRLAKIRPGERVLIHAAAGGVGQAAIQLAHAAGAEVFATASPAKWGLLESAGVRHIMNSRTLDFAERTLALTGGEGVDVVLNSLNGEFIPASFNALRRDGRFLEIGKIGAWDAERARQFRPDASYFIYDIAEEMSKDGSLFRGALTELAEWLRQGRLQPLKTRAFPVTQAAGAFRLMAAGKHTGKLVLSMERETAPVLHRATYLVTGGLGELGLAVARWMVEKGAGRVVLCGRGKPSTAAAVAISEMARTGAQIEVVEADVSAVEQVNALIAAAHKPAWPLRGIVHAAGVLRDCPLDQLDWEKMQAVLGPKAAGAWNLHVASRECPLDFFVCFSSMASALGSPGQANYAAANAYLDALAYHRNALGLPALTINWGPWAEIGMAARMGEQAARRREAHGIGDILPAAGLRMLERLLADQQAVQALAVPLDWRKLPGAASRAFFEAFAQPGKPAADSNVLRELKESPPAKRRLLLTSYVSARVTETIGTQANAIGADEKFLDLGIDSLLAIELRNRLHADLGVPLAQTLIFDRPTVRSLVDHLETCLFGDRVREAPITAPEEPEEREIDDFLDEIGMMSETEIKSRLAEGRLPANAT